MRWTQRLAFLIWDIFCWACCQWRELALVIRKILLFLIIDANLPIDCKLHKRCPRLGMQCVTLCSSCSTNSIGILFVHSWKNVPKSETNFWKQCIITEQWNTVMTPNFAHKIVHSSAMYYQNLIMIHECSKKLLKMKKAKVFFNT